VSVFVQRGGIAALEGSDAPLRAMVAEFAGRRARMLEGFARIAGVRCAAPEGAFYLFPDLTGLGLTSQEAYERLLDAGVAVVPGTSFGARGEGRVRVSFATSLANIEEGLARFARVAESAAGAR
jgi:aspartate aminotransferase